MKLFEYIEQGGSIMYILVLLNIIGLTIIIYKFFALRAERQKQDAIAQTLSSRLSPKKGSLDANSLIELTKQELQVYIGGIEKGLSTVKIIAAIAPLLGLLGTVVGVLVAFRVMSQTGLNNPASFAQGISMALITTVGGLIVAIPHYIGHNYLIGVLDDIEVNLERKLLNDIL
jgi:biopolymer transport protein ExbB